MSLLRVENVVARHGQFQAASDVTLSVAPGDRIAIDIPNRSIQLLVSDEVLAKRRAAMEAKGKDAWKPAQPRKRNVTQALRAYAAFATSAARGAVRVVP